MVRRYNFSEEQIQEIEATHKENFLSGRYGKKPASEAFVMKFS